MFLRAYYPGGEFDGVCFLGFGVEEQAYPMQFCFGEGGGIKDGEDLPGW